MQDDALRSRGGAPAFGPSSHQHYKHSMPMPGQIFPGRFERRRDIDEITISRCCNVGGSGEQIDIQQSASVPQQKRCGSLEGCQRRSSSRSGPSVVQRRSGTYSTAAGLRQAAGKQVNTSTAYKLHVGVTLSWVGHQSVQSMRPKASWVWFSW